MSRCLNIASIQSAKLMWKITLSAINNGKYNGLTFFKCRIYRGVGKKLMFFQLKFLNLRHPVRTHLQIRISCICKLIYFPQVFKYGKQCANQCILYTNYNLQYVNRLQTENSICFRNIGIHLHSRSLKKKETWQDDLGT